MNSPPINPIPPRWALDNPLDRIAYALRHSHYAQRLLDSDPPLRDWLVANIDTPWQRHTMEAMLTAVPINNENTLKHALRCLRKQVLLRLMVRDLTGMADLSEVFATVTTLAEVTVQFAEHHWDRWLSHKYGNPLGESSGKRQRLIIVGMGKLGGEELNVSSDIDLIFAYPEDGETNGAHTISNHEYFIALGRNIISAIGEITADHIVFRVDMRLRPYGDSGALVVSLPMLEQYLETQGREWERYAWIKGRPLSGGQDDALTALVHPFVYRKYLDFGAFAAMRALHAQIRQEVQRRDLRGNIKLGPGGIREIEFSVQVFQLIRGGRDPRLQPRPTLVALDVLAQHRLLSADVARELREAYIFLRNLEHRLQYLDDQQTQTLPPRAEEQVLIAEAMGFANYSTFLHTLHYHRQQVSRHFERIFAAPPNAKEEHPLTALWHGALTKTNAVATLASLGYQRPTQSQQRLQTIRESTRYRQLPAASLLRFDALLPPLIEAASAAHNPDDTLERVLRLLEHIGRRGTYLALLLEYPQALQQVARLCSASAWLSDTLARNPLLLDELLDHRVLYAPQNNAALQVELRETLAEATGDTERQMDALRQFKHAQVFHLAAQDLAGLLSLETLSDHLSTLADLILSEVLHLSWQGLRHRHCTDPHFAIIGYGKLGGRELGYASDLDLIFLYQEDTPEAPTVYAKLGQHINAWLTRFTPAGVLYEIDLRLRPDGASGLLVSQLQAFEQYQKNNAWVWEHQALTRARFIAGDTTIGVAFDRIRDAVLRQQRNTVVLRREIIAMRQKMRTAHPNSSSLFDLKHDSGGIIDVEFIVQYLILAHAWQYPVLIDNVGNLALLQHAADCGLIPADLAEAVREAYRLFRRQQHQLRLQGETNALVDLTSINQQRDAVCHLWDIIFPGETN